MHMDDVTLLGLLDADMEMIQAALNRDRSPAAAQSALEKALDRVSLRYAEQCADAPSRDAAQAQIRAIKSALPLMDAVGEVHRWQKEAEKPRKGRMKPAAIALLAVGVVLELAVMLGLLITGGRLMGVVAILEAIVPAILGMAALFWAGVQFGRPEKRREDAPAVRDEFLIDVEKVCHHLRGMMLLADSAVEGAHNRSAIERQRQAKSDQGPLDPAQAELFAGLLENGYAQDNPDSRELVESLRFYLHGAGVEVVDFAPGRENWFEFLPARKPGTIRPALVYDDKLIKKGLAAN